MAINAVIFDLGRVLVGVSATGEKFGRLMRAMGIEPSRAFAKYWITPEVLQHMIGTIDSREFYRLAKERFDFPHTFEEFVEGWCDLFHPVPAMRKIFLDVKERAVIGLLSDTDPLHWNHLLAAFPWLGRISRPTLSYKIGFLKPHPEAYAAAARNCGRSARECLFIDDVPGNVEGAVMAGMTALHYTGSEKLLKDLRELHIL